MNAKTLYSILLLIVCSSFKNYKKRKLGLLVKEWTNKDILLTKNFIFTHFTIETFSYEIQPS